MGGGAFLGVTLDRGRALVNAVKLCYRPFLPFTLHSLVTEKS